MEQQGLTRSQRVWVVVVVACYLLATAFEVRAEITLEEGATFDGGICWEADGTEGFAHFDGQCITPADYDEMFSYETLSQTTLGSEWDQTGLAGKTIAEVAGIEPEPAASDRPLGVGLVEPGTEESFKTKVARAHTPHMPIAD